MTIRCVYGNLLYLPKNPPVPDDAVLAGAGPRVMLRHKKWDSPEIFVAPHGMVTAGWVIGTVMEEIEEPEYTKGK